MARYINTGTGNWGTAATWNKIINSPSWHATTNITVSTSAKYTMKFTAPNTTNACTGLYVYVSGAGSSASTGNLVITLQENEIDTACVLTIPMSSLSANSYGTSYEYYRFPTPYVFTSTTASYYRFSFIRSDSSAGTVSIGANATSTTLIDMAVTDNETAVPGSTDLAIIAGKNADGVRYTVTMNGTQAIGNRTSTAVINNTTPKTNYPLEDLIISDYGELTWDTAASASLTLNGNAVVQYNGKWTVGSSTVCYPTTKVATLTFSMATSGDHGIGVYNDAFFQWYGEPKSSTSLWKTTLASGVGTAADPAIMATAVDWSVGDKVIIGATSDNATNYNESEVKFIITKNSSTSYVWSDTLGGSEAALANTHSTSAHVLNLTRNVIITSDSTTKGYYINNSARDTLGFEMEWVDFRYAGANISNKSGTSPLWGAYSQAKFNYNVATDTLYIGFLFYTSRITQTFTGNIVANTTSTGSGTSFQIQTAANLTFVDCFCIKNYRSGFGIYSQSANITMTRCIAISCNTGGSANFAGFFLSSVAASTFQDCEAHCNRISGVVPNSTSNIVFNNLLCGTKGKNSTADITPYDSGFYQIAFNNSNFGSDTLVYGAGAFTGYTYLDGVPGCIIAFDTYNDTTDNHIWYTEAGFARSCKAGLVDETVHRTGGMAFRFSIENGTATSNLQPFYHRFTVPIGNIQNEDMSLAIWVKINHANYYAGTHNMPRITVTYDLTSTTYAEAAQTTDWQMLIVPITPLTTTPVISVVLSAQTDATTTQAYVYWADMSVLYPAGTTLNLGEFTSYYNGQPATPPIATTISALDVWAADPSTFGASTVGDNIKKIKLYEEMGL